MNIDDDLLMAYADGELDAPEHAANHAAVEAAMKADPDVARRVEKHRNLRRQLAATFDGVLGETIPESLMAAVQPRGATVTDLRRVRAAKAAESAARSGTTVRSGWSWPQWGAVAASLVIGAVLGHVALQSPEAGPIVSRGGNLVAQAGLAEALSTQLTSTQPATAPVQIGVSFKTKSGQYCRTFALKDAASTNGLACRDGDAWNVQALARAAVGTDAATRGDAGYRQAGSEMPPAVRAAVEEQISGEPLDAGAETQAMQGEWR